MEKYKELLTSFFSEDSQREVLSILENESEKNTHIAFLITAAQQRGHGWIRGVVEYGVDNVSDEEDHQLATLFFVLSNLKDISPLVRDFLMDVMVHCEDLMSPLKNARTIRSVYEKQIRPGL